MMARLTNKQKRFIDEYLIDCNATQAAIRAGYSSKTANEQSVKLLSNVYIQYAIDKKLKEISSDKTANAQEVLEYLTAVMRGETKESVLCLSGKGEQKIVEISVSATDRIKAAELIGKRYGMFKGNIKITSIPVVITGKDDLED